MSKPYDSPAEVEKWDVVRGELRPCTGGDMVSIGDYTKLYRVMLDYKHAYEDTTNGE
jgi:hypothetical protein